MEVITQQRKKVNQMKRQTAEEEKIFVNHLIRSWYPNYKRNTFKSITKKQNKTNKSPTNISIEKLVKALNRYFQRRHKDGQQIHENVLNIPNHQGDANQNHNEISPHTC